MSRRAGRGTFARARCRQPSMDTLARQERNSVPIMICITICDEELACHHEVQALKELHRLRILAVKDIEHLQGEIHDESVEEILRDRVDALHVEPVPAQRVTPIDRTNRRDAGDDGREEKTTGISGVDHHGLALIDPKMNPSSREEATPDGMPIMVIMLAIRSSICCAASLML